MKFVCCLLVALIFNNLARAQDAEGFVSLSPKFTTQAGTKPLTAMLPKVRNQLYWGFCSNFAVQALYAGYRCKVANKPDCDHSPEFMVSVIDLLRYGTVADKFPEDRASYSGFRAEQSSPEEAKANGAESYKKLQTKGLNFLRDDTIQFGSAPIVVLYTLTTSLGYALREDAVPFDKIFGKPGSAEEVLRAGILAKQQLQNLYFSLKDKRQPCDETCLTKAKSLFNFITPDSEIIAAFHEPDYGHFLDKILIPRKVEDDNTDHSFIVIPDEEFKTSDGKRGALQELKYSPEQRVRPFESAIEVIKKNLSNKNAMMILDYCTIHNKPKAFEDCHGLMHTFLINGYKRVCDQDGKNCVDALKVHNSWGQAWQDKFTHEGSDGWVMAKELLDRTYYKDFSIVWFDETAKGTPFPPGHAFYKKDSN